MIRAGFAQAALAVSAIAIAVGVASCARDIKIGYQDGDAGIEAGSVIFTPPPADGGDAASTVSPAPEVPLCASTECPWPWVSCIQADGTLPAYPCATNVGSDVFNCGGCGVVCEWGPPTFHLYPTCLDGKCKVNCEQGTFDCNGITDDGCEVEVAHDPNNCGACGNKCAAGVHCIDGACGCPQGMTECDGECVDLKNSDSNCGQCGFSCRSHPPGDAAAPPPNMFYGCQEGQCKDLRCIKEQGADWNDCNNKIDPDGCEVNLAQPDPDNCGKCGTKCDADKKCFSVSGAIACQCQGGTTYCPGSFWPNYRPETCADLNNDPGNCGACGYACSGFVPNSTATCTNGRCGFKCNEGRMDCNGNTIDGCEADLKHDARNCGGCGIECQVGQPCVDGQCAMKECAPGETK